MQKKENYYGGNMSSTILRTFRLSKDNYSNKKEIFLARNEERNSILHFHMFEVSICQGKTQHLAGLLHPLLILKWKWEVI